MIKTLYDAFSHFPVQLYSGFNFITRLWNLLFQFTYFFEMLICKTQRNTDIALSRS